MRCVALAEELTARGIGVHFLSDLGGLEWAERQLTSRGLPWYPAPYDAVGLVAAADRLGLDAVVVDSYVLPPAHSAALRASGRAVLAIVDGDVRGQEADVYVDQNLDAELLTPDLPPGAVRLAGLGCALLRRAVRDLRPPAPPMPGPADKPRVVAFFGGTDAYRAAPVAARLLIATGVPFSATIVAATDDLRAELLASEPADGQRLDIIAPTDELPRLLSTADLVISASGTSTWELLCLGRAAALVWVVDNQILGYDRTTARGLAAGLGHLPALREFPSEAIDRLRELLSSPGSRAELAARAWAAVDGQGCSRVAEALLGAVHARNAVRPGR
ncbi:spore coat protein [Couchioplanes caeruleus]|uniref:PseG/SpsG family protein n=1 Tax=Couchioplanes caeruleus TaxID=56438 RepID=UPI0020C12D81|nr:spore coat protein [Couchioplanes caeruleus]UQU68758.1 spore coat protein [Couchioplanes caeruleus]